VLICRSTVAAIVGGACGAGAGMAAGAAGAGEAAGAAGFACPSALPARLAINSRQNILMCFISNSPLFSSSGMVLKASSQ
jgi:hypothetical protein